MSKKYMKLLMHYQMIFLLKWKVVNHEKMLKNFLMNIIFPRLL